MEIILFVATMLLVFGCGVAVGFLLVIGAAKADFAQPKMTKSDDESSALN